MIYLELFWSFFQIGLFSIGGGYAAMPLIQHQVIEVHPWLSMTQFADIMAIAEMTPGPIAINSATFVGIQVGGLAGALAATLGCVLPSCIIVMTLAFLYYRYRGLSLIQGVLFGLRPAVVAMIASAGLSLMQLAFFGQESEEAETVAETATTLERTVSLPFGKEVFLLHWDALLIFCLALLLLRRWKISPIRVMAGAGFLGVLFGFVM